jgi:hypothetical protein
MMEFVVGDHIKRSVQITENDVPFVIDPTSILRARLVHLATGATSDIVTTDGTEPEANWAISQVILTFPKAVSEGFTVGRNKIEIEIEHPPDEPQTYFVHDILVLPQTIT